MRRRGDEVGDGSRDVPRSVALGKDSFELDVAYWEAVRLMRDEFVARCEGEDTFFK